MKKRLFVIITCLCMVFAFTACGSGSEETSQNQDSANVDNEEEAENTGSYVSDTDWKEVTSVLTDSNGYKVEATYKISPWMLLSSNEDMIDSAWKEVGEGNEIPKTPEEWGLKKDGNSYLKHVAEGVPLISDCNDMYYCVGTITLANITEGWDFSEDNTYTAHPNFQWQKDDFETMSSVDSLMNIYYSNDVKETSADGKSAVFDCKMDSNSWGPVPFVIMAPEEVSPNNPSGQNLDKILDGCFYLGSDNPNVTIGVYGQDGEFFESTYTEQ